MYYGPVSMFEPYSLYLVFSSWVFSFHSMILPSFLPNLLQNLLAFLLLFIYLCLLHWVFLALLRLSPIAENEGYPWLWYKGFSLRRLHLLKSTDSRMQTQ